MDGIEPLEDTEVSSMRITHLFQMMISGAAAAQASDLELAAVAGLILGSTIPGAVEPGNEHDAVLAFYQDGVDHWAQQEALIDLEAPDEPT